MIRIRCTQRENLMNLLVAGHAGYAQRGQDVVCAGVSALINALASTLVLLGETSAQIDLGSARAQITCCTDSVLVYSLYYQTLVGLVAIAREYPQYIDLRTAGFFCGEERNKEDIA